MKTRIAVTSFVVALAMAATGCGKSKTGVSSSAAPDGVEGTPQTVCPVMGGKINSELYVDAEGKRIYVCCEGCIAAVKKEPAKYVKKLEEQGITLKRTPTRVDHDHEGHHHQHE